MALDAWLPVGHKLPDGAKSRVALFEGTGWQILETQGNGRALVARDELASRWVESGLIDQGALTAFEFGKQRYWSISCGPSQVLCPVSDGKSPDTKAEALAFAQAFKATREAAKESPLQDALYAEKISRLLP
ncbi:MAG: ATP-binding protein, partial [Pyrinomonadaceae bacterium]